MAEPAQPEMRVSVSESLSPTSVKQEHSMLEASLLDALDFAMPPPPPPTAAPKRPFEADPPTDDDQSKRIKTETEHPPHENGFQEDHSAETLDDSLALLVQNALDGVGDLVDQFSQEPEIPHTTADAMDLDTTPIHDDPLPPPPVTFVSDPEKFLRNTTRHALGNIAISILLALSQQPSEDIVKPLRDRDSVQRQSFGLLQSSFHQIKQCYAPNAPTSMLTVDELDLLDDESRTIVDLTNLAQMAIWLVEGDLPSYTLAQDHFHSVFPGQIADLPPDVVQLHLMIKSQTGVESLASKTSEQQIDQLLDEALVNGLEEELRGLHGGFELTEADKTVVDSVKSRKEALQGEAQHQTEISQFPDGENEALSFSNDAAAAMREKYPADDLLRSFCIYVKGRLIAASDLGAKFGLAMPTHDDNELDLLSGPPVEGLNLDDLDSFFEKTTSGLVQNALAGLEDDHHTPVPVIEEIEAPPVEEPKDTPKPEAEGPAPQTNGKVDLMTDYKELEALVAESTSNYVKTTLHGLSPVPYQPTVPTSTTQSYLSHLQQQTHPQHSYYSYTQQLSDPPPPPPVPGENLPPNQTCSSADLYDKARQAAISKNNAQTRREGIHSTRRPWTQEEEKALMAGLDMVKGPHWSQILTLFGQNGTISDILKDRTQVQLKDKARNLKLFFLKTNSEMPYYLKAVTGELKTRAPTQAARKEAEERARMNSEEEQARIQGIMTLAGGLQNPPQGRPAGSPATAVGPGVMTPAQAASAAQQASSQPGSAQHGAPGSVAPITHSGYPASSLPQARPTVQATTQQTLQSVPHAPPRPQTQLPLPTPQPQAQAQPQHQQQLQQHHTTTSPVQQQNIRSHPSTPNGQTQHSPANHHTPATQNPRQPTPLAFPTPLPQQQSPYTPSPQVTQAPQAHMVSQAPVPEPQPHHDSNAEEAALINHLQDAMAQDINTT